MKENEISIRSIQHYLYCPHRWGLIEIDRAWAENYFVTKANLMHERVHTPAQGYLSRGEGYIPLCRSTMIGRSINYMV